MTCALAMIVRDEAANLPACLESVRGLFDETVIVDTGSTDDTVKIARSFGARVFHFPWVDDFSAARNHGLDRVRSDFVFRLDADDRLYEGHRKRLKALLLALDPAHPAAFFCRVHSHEPGVETTLDEQRLWPHRPTIRFRGAIHERIRLEHDAPDVPVLMSRVALRHHGYATMEIVRPKLQRNLRIMEKEIARGPVEPLTLFDYGRTLAGCDRPLEALDALKAFLARRDPAHKLASKIAHRRIVEIHRVLGDPRAAIAAAQAGLKEHPDDAQLAAWAGALLEQCEEWDLAREGYAHALALHDPSRPDAGMPTNFVHAVREAIARLPAPAA